MSQPVPETAPAAADDGGSGRGRDIFVLIPTFRETAHVRRLIDDLRAQTVQRFTAAVINSDPGDATSAFLADAAAGRGPVVELRADPSVYWSGAIALGQAWLLDAARPADDDTVIVLNTDIRLAPDFLERARATLAPLGPRAMVCAATVAADDGAYVSSGCRMLSWPLALTRHYLVGRRAGGEAAGEPIPVDMLAGRALCFPARALREVGTVAARALPHYCGDYEYTARARRRGYRLYVAPRLRVVNDTANTGVKSSNPRSTLRARLRGLTDVKSSMNLKYRTRFVLLTYPWYSVPTALAVNWIKVFLEVGFGELAYRVFTLRRT